MTIANAANSETQIETPPVSDSATDSAPAAPAVEASQQEAEAAAVVETTTEEINELRAKLATAETKRIPDLQRELSKKEAERTKAIADARNFRSQMLEWTRKELLAAGLDDRWRDIESREQERTGQVLQTEAQRAETMEIINDLLDTDDAASRGFARFLKAQVKAGQQVGTPIRITRENVDSFRESFDAARGAGVSTPPPATTAVPATAQTRTPAVATGKTPARTVTPAAPPQGNPEPPVYEQTKGSARGMFARAFARKEGTQET